MIDFSKKKVDTLRKTTIRKITMGISRTVIVLYGVHIGSSAQTVELVQSLEKEASAPAQLTEAVLQYPKVELAHCAQTFPVMGC